MSIREIARTFGRPRQTVRKVRTNGEPSRFQRCELRSAPKRDPVKPIIDRILNQDEQAPAKQQHTTVRIFERLMAEHSYRGGCD